VSALVCSWCIWYIVSFQLSMDYLTAWVIMVLLLDGQSLSEESFFFSYYRDMLKWSGGWYRAISKKAQRNKQIERSCKILEIAGSVLLLITLSPMNWRCLMADGRSGDFLNSLKNCPTSAERCGIFYQGVSSWSVFIITLVLLQILFYIAVELQGLVPSVV